MEKDVMIEFAKLIGRGLLFVAALLAANASVTYVLAIITGVTFGEAWLPDSSIVLVVMMVWFAVDVAWHRAKLNVKFRNKYGEEA